MRDTRNQTLGLTLLAAGTAAAAAFIGTAHVVRTRRAHPVDRKVRRKVPHGATKETPHGRAIERVQKLGKWWMQGPMTAVAAAALVRTGHGRAASALTLASASSGIAQKLFDDHVFRRQPPPGHPKQGTPSFPSGHAIQLAAVSLTAGYVLMREKIAPAAIAMPLAVGLPMLSSGARLYQDRHWASDVIGGWLVGIALASWSSAAYELLPDQGLSALTGATQGRVGPLAREVARGSRPGARVVARGAARVAEKVVSRAVARAADMLPARRKPGFLDIARAFAEDVLSR
jgi:membrane-associated phospholipid phosphatase